MLGLLLNTASGYTNIFRIGHGLTDNVCGNRYPALWMKPGIRVQNVRNVSIVLNVVKYTASFLYDKQIVR